MGRERQPALLGSAPFPTILSRDFHSLWSVQWKVPQAQLALRPLPPRAVTWLGDGWSPGAGRRLLKTGAQYGSEPLN